MSLPLPDQAFQPFWERVYASFDPLRPVEQPALRVSREKDCSPTEKIVPLLSSPFENQRILVAGGIGSGKSTELLVTAERLVAQRTVVLVDLWRHMESGVKDPGAIEHLQPWEILALVGLAVLRAADELFRLPCADQAKALARALGNLQGRDPGEPSLDVGRLATGLAVAVGGGLVGPAGGAATLVGIEVLKAVGNAWSWKVGLRDARRRNEQDEAVEDLVAATAGLIHHLHEALNRRVVVLVDGLDRVRIDETFRAIFADSALLHRLPCDIVVSAHLALVHRFGALLRYRRYDLSNEPVADPSDPWSQGKGIAFFRALVELRLRAIQRDGVVCPIEPFPAVLIDRLAWCSGGRLRDFIGFVRDIALLAYPGFPAADEILANSVIEDARRRKSDGLDADQIQLLERVARDPLHRLPGGDLAIRLLEQQILLSYPNRDIWYLPHPLLMLTLIRPGLTG